MFECLAASNWDVVMIDSIRPGDGFGESKRVDRAGPPADEGVWSQTSNLLEVSRNVFIYLNIT